MIKSSASVTRLCFRNGQQNFAAEKFSCMYSVIMLIISIFSGDEMLWYLNNFRFSFVSYSCSKNNVLCTLVQV